MKSYDSLPYCVIGAGPSGLTATKNLLEAGIDCVCLEREDDVGGNWYFDRPHSSVYEGTHLISSGRLTEYTDFPMPAEYPAYPSHWQVRDYLKSYADHFGLRRHIRFGVEVERVTPGDGAWQVHCRNDSKPLEAAGVIIANGHHWDPLLPKWDGEFDGEIVHSKQFKRTAQLAGRRVLVVGAGNSGCDIAVEAAQHADCALLSMRRGYHFLPKFLRGKPVDQCGERLHRWGVPLGLQRVVAGAMLRTAVGSPQQYGLPKPDHRLFETHPIINSQLLYFAGHGRIAIKPDVTQLLGAQVEFSDGSRETLDLIICATGFKISLPFIDRALLPWQSDRPQLYLHVFHPERDDLFVAGLIQPNSGLWGLVDLQMQLASRYIRACRQNTKQAEWFRRLKQSQQENLSAGIRYVKSPRHALEVEYFTYRKRLQQLIAKFPRPR